jgi:hypothetical protein
MYEGCAIKIVFTTPGNNVREDIRDGEIEMKGFQHY